MTSRERVLAAIAHREPDRVPADLGSTPSSGISAIAYGNFKRHLGLTAGRTRVYDVVQQLAQPEDAILDRCGIDVVDIGRTFNPDDGAWYDIRLGDGQPAQYPAWFHPERQPDGSWLARLAESHAFRNAVGSNSDGQSSISAMMSGDQRSLGSSSSGFCAFCASCGQTETVLRRMAR